MRLRHYLMISYFLSLLVTVIIVGWGINRMLIAEKEAYFIIFVTVIASLVGIIINILFLSRVFLSFKKLKNALQVIPKRRFQKVEGVKTPVEFKELADSFNVMSQQLSEVFNSLEKSEQEKNFMIAQLSHDIKTPITSIQATIEGMLDHIIEPEEYSYYFKTIHRQTNRLNSLVTELNQVSLETTVRAVDSQFEIIFMDKLLLEILSEFQYRIDKEKRDVILEIEPENLKIYSHREKLSRILLNIVGNALKYSPTGSPLMITSKIIHDEICISVRDEGQGIPKHELENIFKRLYRVESSRNMETGGHGLGLYISQELARQLGGKIEVVSHVGKGTCFTLNLPHQNDF